MPHSAHGVLGVIGMVAKDDETTVLLDSVDRVVADPEVIGVRLCRKGCDSFACKVCGPVAGLRLAERLTDRYKAAGVERIGFFTLTISDAVLPFGEKEQYRRIVEGRLIGEFMRKVRSVLGVCGPHFRVCEFGGKKNRLHFHLLVDDLRLIKPRRLKELQGWCQQHIGTMDYKYLPAKAGIRYACKYVTKGSRGQLPEFVLNASGFKFYSVSRGFWMSDAKCRPVGVSQVAGRLIERYNTAEVVRVGMFALSVSSEVMPFRPEEQYRQIVKRGLVRKFIEKVRLVLGEDGAYFRMCEFCAQTNRLHFHLLVDNLGRVTDSQLLRIRDWCHKNVGGMEYKWRPADVGVRYVSRYLLEGSSGRLSELMKGCSNFKYYSASRGFWINASKPAVKREQRELSIRLSRCGNGVVGLVETIGEDGTVARSFGFALPVPFERVVAKLNEVSKNDVLARGSTWPVGVLRWVEVTPECLRALLMDAVIGAQDGRAAERLAGRSP